MQFVINKGKSYLCKNKNGYYVSVKTKDIVICKTEAEAKNIQLTARVKGGAKLETWEIVNIDKKSTGNKKNRYILSDGDLYLKRQNSCFMAVSDLKDANIYTNKKTAEKRIGEAIKLNNFFESYKVMELDNALQNKNQKKSNAVIDNKDIYMEKESQPGKLEEEGSRNINDVIVQLQAAQSYSSTILQELKDIQDEIYLLKKNAGISLNTFEKPVPKAYKKNDKPDMQKNIHAKSKHMNANRYNINSHSKRRIKHSNRKKSGLFSVLKSFTRQQF